MVLTTDDMITDEINRREKRASNRETKSRKTGRQQNIQNEE